MRSMNNMNTKQRTEELARRVRKAGINMNAVREHQQTYTLSAREIGVLPELPSGWKLVEETFDGAKYMWRGGVSVILSAAVELDGRRWLHVSACRVGKGVSGIHKTKTPSYFDLKLVKSIFIGDHRKAVQVFPAQDEHVNLHDHVLHLFACLDDDPLPDFTRGLGTI